MDPTLLRIALLVRLLAFMALVYLALEALVTRLSRKPGSKLLWFFQVLTGPLTAPVRRLLGPEAPPGRVRLLTAALFFAVWLAAAWLTARQPSGLGG